MRLLCLWLFLQEEDVTFPCNATASLEGALQEDQQNELHAAENLEHAKICSSDHPFMSSSNSVKVEDDHFS